MPETICPRCGAFTTSRCKECGFLLGEVVDPWIGRELNGFTLLRQLSSSPESTIYEAQRGEARAAIKLLFVGLDTELIERFKREALAIQRLSHPAVVRLLSQGHTKEGHPFTVIELIRGETLRDRIERQLFTEDELRALLKPLCEALEEAHQKGIVHRDITPRNIMLEQGTGNGERGTGPEGEPRASSAIFPVPRLLDFGFAGLRGEATLTERGAVSGTPAYMAPEQWKGLNHADPISDLYSLAVIAYQCLSGKLPISAKTPLEWLKKHSFEKVTDLKEALGENIISEKVHRAIMRALQKNPSERQASVAAFFSELF